MSFDSGLKQGQVIDTHSLNMIFKCQVRGGMRRSKSTNILVIVSDHTKPFYEDFWVGDVLHYTGMGQKGDQSLDFMQNRTLRYSNTNKVDVHLFEVFEEGKYIYQGEVKLVDEPYQKVQRDFEGNKRLTWMFPVKIINGEP